MMVNLHSGRNLVVRAVVESSKTKVRSRTTASAVSNAGGTAEDKDKGGEEKIAITAGIETIHSSCSWTGLCVTWSTTSTTDSHRRRTVSKSSRCMALSRFLSVVQSMAR